MPIGFNDAEPQKTFEVIPDGTFCKLLLQIKPGRYTIPGGETMDNGLFREPKEAGAAVTMECEFTVLDGPYKHRKFVEYWTVSGGALDEKGHSKGWNITKTRIRAAIESNQGLRSDDQSAQAVATRQINGFAELNNLSFFAKIGVDPGEPYTDQMTGAQKMGFDKNKIDRIITADMVEYADLAAGKPVEPKPSSRARKAAEQPAHPGRSWGGPDQANAKTPELPLNTTAAAPGGPTTTGPKPAWLNR